MGILKERPHSFNLAGNEIRYRFLLADLARPGLRLQVKLLYKGMGVGAAEEEYDTWTLKPDAGGNAYIYLQEELNSLLTWVTPDTAAVFTNAEDQMRIFYIHFREITTADPDPAWDETEEAKPRKVLKAGIEKNRHSRNNFFINYFDANKSWLTWQPQNRYVFTDQKLYLTALRYDTAVASYVLKIRVMKIDGTEATTDVAIASTAHLLHVAVDLDTHGLDDDDVWWYSLKLENEAGATIAGEYKYFIEKKPVYEVHNLVYHSSLGGLDCVRALGDMARAVDRSVEETSGGFSLTKWQDQAMTHEIRHTGINCSKQYKGDVGWLNTRREQEVMQELLHSESIYMFLDGRWMPVVVTQRSGELGRNSDTKWSFPIEWRLAESNKVFTPDWIELGAGEDNEVY